MDGRSSTQRGAGVELRGKGLGYEADDHESKAFFDALPFSKSGDAQFGDCILAVTNETRRREAPYGVDDLGRLTFNG